MHWMASFVFNKQINIFKNILTILCNIQTTFVLLTSTYFYTDRSLLNYNL